MISISNSDYREPVDALKDQVGSYVDSGDLRAYNRYRRRKILLRKLSRKHE